VRSGDWRGHTGKPITDIVNIGIGGSDLGPKMAVPGAAPVRHPRLTMHFVSNVDGADLAAALAKADPETTLFIIASKTFTTAETMHERALGAQMVPEGSAGGRAAAAFRGRVDQAKPSSEFGIDPANMFPFWDWVGGRYSVWSAIGLPVALAVGFGYFSDFLAGAHAMDQHFRSAPLEENMPVLLALVGFWNRQCSAAPRCRSRPTTRT
jgi:glucose-6-phosphate isomerase